MTDMTNKEIKQKVLEVFNKISMGDMQGVQKSIDIFSLEDFHKLKPLFLANSVISGSFKLTEYFIEHGANVNHQIGNKNLLDIAEENNLNKISNLLIINGAKNYELKEEITHSQLLKEKLSPPRPKPKFAR